MFFQVAQIEGILWSIADVLLVFAALKFVNLIRVHNGLKPYHKLYYLLFFSFALTPLLLFSSHFLDYIAIEGFVVSVQYLILVYVMYMNYKIVFKTFEEI